MVDIDDPTELIRVVMTSGRFCGRELAFWQAAEISRGLDRLAASFSLAVGRGKLLESGYSRLPVSVGDGCTVYIGSDLIFVGWIDKIKRSRTATEHAVNIQGRSIAGDLVDCSACNVPGQWAGVSTSAIARALTSPFGIPIQVAAGVDRTVKNFEIEQSETVFAALERLAHAAGAILHDLPSGVVRIGRPGQARAATRLLHRDGADGGPDSANNVLESEADFDFSKRFSVISAHGQAEGGVDDVGATGQAVDSGVARYRPLIVSPPGQATAADCTRLAQWEVARRAGKSLHLVHRVRGWRQTAGGSLWDVDLICGVTDDQAELDRDLLITEVKWVLDASGRRTLLTLEPVEAWTPKPVIDSHVGTGGDTGKWAHVAALTRGS